MVDSVVAMVISSSSSLLTTRRCGAFVLAMTGKHAVM